MCRTKLLFIGALPPPHHGVTGMNDILLRELRGSGQFAIRHVDLADHRPISTVERFDPYNVWAALRAGLAVSWHLATWRPDLVYCPVSQSTLGFIRDALFLVPGRTLGRRMIIHLHGGNFHEFYRQAGRPVRALIRFALGRVHCAIVLGEGLRHCFAGLIPPERIAVIPNAVPDAPAPIACRPEADASRPLRVLHFGTLSQEKGTFVFLEAAQELLWRKLPIAFTVAGPWYRAAEQQRAESIGADRLRFVGPVTGSDKERLLASHDVLVFSSIQQEGLPMVVLEAMAAGLAVIASDCGCLAEVVQPGQTGFLLPPGDTAALVAVLETLARDPTRCALLGTAGRHRQQQFYGLDNLQARITTLFRQIA